MSLDRANEILRAEGLKDGTSFFVRQISAGAPLAPTTHYMNGSRFAYFTVQALALIQRFDVRVVVRDSLGDVHECVFPAMDRLPTVTTKAIRTRGRGGIA